MSRWARYGIGLCLVLVTGFGYAQTEMPEFDDSIISNPDDEFAGRAVLIAGRSGAEQSRLNKAKEVIARLVADNPEWEQAFIILDTFRDRRAVNRFYDRYDRNQHRRQMPLFVFVDDTKIERHIHWGCRPKLDIWTMAWLFKGVDERPVPLRDSRPAGEIRYPLTAHWWSVEGDWRPSREKVIRHLLDAPLHEGAPFERWWLDLLSFEELQSLHTDHHRELIGSGEVRWQYINQETPPDADLEDDHGYAPDLADGLILEDDAA